MNRLIHRFAFLVGTVLLAATAASAQNVRGTIPFAFNAGGADLPAGSYEFVRQTNTVPLWVLRNVETRKQVVVMSPTSATRASSDERAALTFRCSGESCALESLYTTGKTVGYSFPVNHKIVPDVQVATVRTVHFGD